MEEKPITYDDLLKMVEDMSKPVPRDNKVYIPPNLLERAKKDYPNVEWVPECDS